MDNQQITLDELLGSHTGGNTGGGNWNNKGTGNNDDNIIDVEYSEIMQKSYLDYAMSVITARAVPDVRDGLKPVQRRVLYDMDELGVNSDKEYRKCARIVGDTMGKYHPHGDASIYEAQVVMAQEFKKELPLVDGHGNFGSIEGDGSAAMRYTEAKLKKYTEDVFLAELPYDTVDYIDNYDSTEVEPTVLPCKLPNLLINGSDGIAVGMATNIPPHNINDVIDTALFYFDNPQASNDELLEYLHGPDFPTKGIVCNKDDLNEIYATGTGKIKLRGKFKFEKGKGKEKDKLVVTEIPYTMIGEGINKFLTTVADLVKNKTIQDISDIQNQTSKDGIRIVFELKKNADIEHIKTAIYKKTKFEDTFGVNILTICNGEPKTLSLKQYMDEYVKFQYEITTRKYQHLLPKAIAQKEKDEGLIRAIDILDLIIEIIRGSKNISQVKKCLTQGCTDGIKFRSEKSKKEAAKLDFTALQADAIVDMRLSRLVGLELDILMKDYQKVLKTISEYERILGSKTVMKNLIKKEITELKSKFGVERKTLITNRKEAVFVEKEEEEKDVIALMDRFGYIHIVEKNAYERSSSADDEYCHIIEISNKDRLMIFTDTGMVHNIKVQDIPYGKVKDKGIPIDNLCNYDSSKERMLFITKASTDGYIVFITSDSMIKRVPVREFETRNKSMIATKLNTGEKVIKIGMYDEKGYIILKSDDGFKLKFKQSEIPEKKKNAVGAIGMKMKPDERLKKAKITDETYTDELSISKRAKRGKR